MSLEIGRFEGNPSEWDAFVAAHAGRTHFHSWGWKSVIERALGHECIYLAARSANGRLQGVLPLVRVSSPVFGRYLVSMPFLNYGGPLGTNEAVTGLVARAVELAESQRIDLLELRSRSALPLQLPVSHRKVTVVLDLSPREPDRLWHGLKAKVRSQIRRPQKEGVSVRFGLDQVEPFFKVFSRHMRDLGTPTQSRRLFEMIADTFPSDVWFGCAYHRERPVAAGCGFRWDGEFEMTWASALSEYRPIAPNMLLYWAFMERAALHGIRLFNFGRCTPGGSTHRFKRQWGSRDVELWWYQHAAGRRAATPSPDERAFVWAARAWTWLPLPLANFLGPRVVRLIP